MTLTPALRVCLVYIDELAHQCPNPLCRIEQCSKCLRDVHYHPGDYIPALGPETIVCTACVPIETFIDRRDGSWTEPPTEKGPFYINPDPGPFMGAQDPAFRLPPGAQN